MKLAHILPKPLLALVLTFQALVLASICWAQDGVLVFEEEGVAQAQLPTAAGPAERDAISFVAHLPGAKTHPAPDWVKPGTRLTMWMGTASVNDSSSVETVVEDPNGNLVDSSGKRYRQSTSGGFTDTGAAGAGFIQIDVVHVSSVGVKLDIRNYTGDGQYNAPQVQMVEGALVNGGSCEYWIHPALLAQVKPGSNGVGSVFKGPWKVRDQTYQAVIFVLKTGGSKQSIAYDLTSGIALSQSSVYRSSSKHTQYDPNTGRTKAGSSNHKTLMESCFVGIRNLNLPWTSEPFSPGASQFKTAKYSGQMNMEPSMGAPASMQEDHVRVGRSEPGCVGLATKKLFPGMDPAKAPEFPRYSAVHQIGGFFMNPAALRKLRQGQVIDQDPHTKIRTHVEYMGPSAQGNQIVGILEEGAGSSLRWIYDVESGELYAYATIIPYGPEMTSVSQYSRVWR